MSNYRKAIESGKCTIVVPEPAELGVKLHTMPTKFLKYEAWEPLEVRCDGYSHQMWNLASAYAEAFGLNRTLILPDTICEPGLHNFGQWLKLPTKGLVDVELLQELGHWVALPDDPFLLDLQTAPSFRMRTIQGERGTFEELRRVEEDMVIRKEALGWWGVIDSAPKSLDLEGVRLDFEADITSPKLQHAVADAIAKKMGVYDSIHVRRGDKIGTPAFEQLDAETQPGAIMERLAKACPPGSRLYIASNEPDEDFFSPLSALYELYTWRDFADLLVEGSIVHQDTSIGCFLDAKACQYRVFNNFYLFQIERQVFRKARKHMETFNFLSKHHANGGCCTELEDLSVNKSSLVDRY